MFFVKEHVHWKVSFQKIGHVNIKGHPSPQPSHNMGRKIWGIVDQHRVTPQSVVVIACMKKRQREAIFFVNTPEV